MNDNEKFSACALLDKVGYATLTALMPNITAYAINTTISADYDCIKARDYYVKKCPTVDLSNYQMHHTLDGHIVPVSTELHKSTSHHGGVVLFGLTR